jgi:hypothetical protein
LIQDEEGPFKRSDRATKIIFLKMTADGPIDTITNEMQPLIEYFESLKTKYKEEDKNSKKIRYSAFTIWVEFIFILINLRKYY